jgi:hypothetical protein
MSLRDELERKGIPELVELCVRVAAIAPRKTLGYRKATELRQDWDDLLTRGLKPNLEPDWPKGSQEDTLKRQLVSFLTAMLPLYGLSY